MQTLLGAALEYARLGWSVFPVQSVVGGRCSCKNKNCQNPGKHPRTPNGLHDATMDPLKIQGWWRTYPDSNIGIATGSISGLYVLDIDPRHGGDDSLDGLEQTNGRIARSVECFTGGGGRHMYFKYPQTGMVRNHTNVPGLGLDVRGDGGYVVAPPSGHVSGHAYEWEATSDPVSNVLIEAPAWLQAVVVELPTNHQQATQQTQQTPKTATAGGRNTLLTRQAGKLRRQGFMADEIEAALLKYNQNRCVPPLDDDEVRKIAKSVSRYAPAQVPTDDELADAWLGKHPDTVYGLGEFRRYQDGCWPLIPLSQVEAELELIQEAAKRDGYKPSFYKLKSIMELARIKCTVPSDRWNADKDLLVCKNGTLHIPTLTLGAHDKSNYLTAGVAYPYDPHATAPTWDYFCQTRLDSKGDFLQEFAGYALTIDTSLETAIWLYGPPGSGKSTFITGLTTMLGSRAGLLGLADLEKSRFSLTDLPDKTLLVSTEQPSMYLQATERVNALISGEPVMIDRKFRDPVIVTSRAKICWAMNELPRVGEANNGLFRRVKVVEFDDLPEGARNPDVKNFIQTEGSGLLNWSLEGLLRLRSNNGFTIPEAVHEATALFKRLNDIPKVFLEEKCEIDDSYSVSSAALYTAYRDWCFENGHKPQSSTSLGIDWRRMGFKSQHARTGNIWVGVRIKVFVP